MPVADAQEKIRLEAEIAKLTGAINRQTARGNAYKPYPTRGRGGYRGRGSAPRSMVPDNHRMPFGISPASTSSSAAASGSSSGWVKNTSRTGNKSLMNPETFLKTEKARLARPAKVPRKHVKRHQHGNVQLLSSDASAAGPRRVVIDNVVFEFEDGGGKLVRIGDQAGSAKPEMSTPTRKRLSLSGHQYVRTKSGNMLSAETVRKRSSKGKASAKAGIPCRYFTKTGRCNRALTCPYKHDPTRLSICPRYLRGKCPYTALTCPVSHVATAHNAPSCVHFQINGQCRNDPCVYPHIRVADDAPVCDAFAREGWCDKGAACTERHAWECREFREKGTCARGAKCGLMHIFRAEQGRVLPEEPPVAVEGPGQEVASGDFDDGGEYIQFLDDQQDDDAEDEEESSNSEAAVDSDHEDEEEEDEGSDGDSDSSDGIEVDVHG